MAIDAEADAIESLRKFDELSSSPISSSFVTGLKIIVPILNVLLPPNSRIPDPLLATLVGSLAHLEGVFRKRTESYWAAVIDAVKARQRRIESGERPMTLQQ